MTNARCNREFVESRNEQFMTEAFIRSAFEFREIEALQRRYGTGDDATRRRENSVTIGNR